jgi:hypothetical protein
MIATPQENVIRPALYYPYIHIRDENWLKATLLCVPVVKRLVPDNYTTENDPCIFPFTQIEGPLGPLLQLEPATSETAVDAQRDLHDRIQQNLAFFEERFSRANAPDPDQYWIHDAKFYGEFLRFLEENNLAWVSENPEAYGHRSWYALHPMLGKAIMTASA